MNRDRIQVQSRQHLDPGHNLHATLRTDTQSALGYKPQLRAHVVFGGTACYWMTDVGVLYSKQTIRPRTSFH